MPPNNINVVVRLLLLGIYIYTICSRQDRLFMFSEESSSLLTSICSLVVVVSGLLLGICMIHTNVSTTVLYPRGDQNLRKYRKTNNMLPKGRS